MRVKICGITNEQDALDAALSGADAVGFVFYKNSPRYVEPSTVAKISKLLPPFIQRVGLFVNKSSDEINEICHIADVGLAQIHFDADEELIRALNIKHLRVKRVGQKSDLVSLDDGYWLVDAKTEGYGGAGERLNLEWFDGVDCSRLILAGGLTPENVSEAKRYGFYGVDVSSGVEGAQKGLKDAQKVANFIKNAKQNEVLCL